VDHDRAVGGEAENGGNGLGGGIYEDAHSTLTLKGVTVEHNRAIGGEGDDGGIGGGLYLASGGSAYLDAFTQANVKHNDASTSNDDIFGYYTVCWGSRATFVLTPPRAE
jgi:hypothetical protein